MLSSKLLRAFTDDAYDSRAGKTLREALRANESASLDAIRGGSIASTSANGRHVALVAAAGGGNVTQVHIAEGWRRLIDTHDAAADSLGYNITTTDGAEIDAIRQQMLATLREIKGYTDNYMYLVK